MNWFLGLISLLTCVPMSSANMFLRGRNFTLSFDDVEANFAPSIEGSGVCGVLHLASPIDACSPLDDMIDQISNRSSRFLLIVRGGCSFETKVRRAQKAGYKAAIVYDNEDDGLLVSMAGNAADIKIHAVFVSKASGETLIKYAGFTVMDVWIFPNFENSAWSIIAISFISLLAMSAVLGTCLLVRRHRMRQERPQASPSRKFHGMSSQLVKAMPSLIFTAILEDNCTSMTCAICLEDYSVGEELRILPCRHKFHASCVDSWLTTWRTFCPICKHDARADSVDQPVSETTPLISSRTASVASSSALSSFRSSLPSLLRPPSGSRPQASAMLLVSALAW